MKFYYKPNAFVVDNKILPQGKYGLEQIKHSSYIVVNMSNGNVVTQPTKITEFQKEDGSYYTSLLELLSEAGKFFL